MSMKTSIVYGYGFTLPEYSMETAEKVRDFITSNKKWFSSNKNEEAILDGLASLPEDMAGFEDLFADYPCELTGQCGWGAAIANIMHRKTGIGFEYQPGCADCDSKAAVMLSMQMPWNFTEKEFDLKEDYLKFLMQKYATDIGAEEEPDYLSIEYYG